MRWERVRLGDVLAHRKGSIVIDDTEEYKLCKVQLHRRGVVLRERRKGSTIKTKKQQVCKSGDFLVAEMDAKVGGYGFVPKDLDGAIVSSHYYLFELNTDRITEDFLEVICQTTILQQQIKATGSTNYASIRPADVLAWEIDLPSLDEQILISNKILSTKKELKKVGTEVSHQLELVRQLRQAFLREAMQGKLVPQNDADEPAEALLKKIKAEKANLIAEKKIKKEKPLPEIKPEEIPFEIPSNWAWCRLGNITDYLNGYAFKSSWFKKDGIRLVRNANVGHGNLAWKAVAKLPEELSDEFREYFLDEDDIVLSLDRPIIATGLKIARITRTDLPCLLLQRVLKVIPIQIFSDYLFAWFNSEYFVGSINPGRSIGIPHVSHNEIIRIPFPLPPLAEQKRIVEKLEKLMAFCDKLEANIRQSKHHAETLLQVALKEALEPQ